MPDPIAPDRVTFKGDHLQLAAADDAYRVDDRIDVMLDPPYGRISATVTRVEGGTVQAVWDAEHDMMVRAFFAGTDTSAGPTS